MKLIFMYVENIRKRIDKDQPMAIFRIMECFLHRQLVLFVFVYILMSILPADVFRNQINLCRT